MRDTLEMARIRAGLYWTGGGVLRHALATRPKLGARKIVAAIGVDDRHGAAPQVNACFRHIIAFQTSSPPD
jgi:hypothetical protein